MGKQLGCMLHKINVEGGGGGSRGSSWGQMTLGLALDIGMNLFLGCMPTFWVGLLPQPMQIIAAAV